MNELISPVQSGQGFSLFIVSKRYKFFDILVSFTDIISEEAKFTDKQTKFILLPCLFLWIRMHRNRTVSAASDIPHHRSVAP